MRLAAAALACTASLVVVGAATGAPEVDQQQTVIHTGAAPGIGGPANQRLAQQVLPAIPGLLTEVQLPVFCEPQSTLLVEIRDAVGTPGATVFASQTVPGSSLPFAGPTFRSIAFSNPPFLPAELSFAIVLSATGPWCGTYASPDNSDAYARGGFFYSELPDQQWRGPFFGDLAFKTLVDRRCRVPNLVGGPASEVQAALTRNGCAVGSTRQAYSRTVPARSVTSQSPPAETLLAFGTPVSVIVSRGPPPCILPRLRGKTLRQARLALTRANCRLGRVNRRPATRAARGRVVGQQPAPGRRLRDRGRVNVVLGR